MTCDDSVASDVSAVTIRQLANRRKPTGTRYPRAIREEVVALARARVAAGRTKSLDPFTWYESPSLMMGGRHVACCLRIGPSP